jgi:hypothetical protein
VTNSTTTSTNTPAVPADAPELVDRYPGLERWKRTATRLRPRPGRVAADVSHIGGPLRWPATTPWPHCNEPHVTRVEHRIPDALAARYVAAKMRMQRDWAPGTPMHSNAEFDDTTSELAELFDGYVGVRHTQGGLRAVSTALRAEPGGYPLVPVAQLQASDIPDLRCPAGTSLAQVLWCPNEHYLDDDYAGPLAAVRWARPSLGDMAATAPQLPTAQPGLIPQPCTLNPDQVVEYPWWEELTDTTLAHRLRDEPPADYRQLATAPGWKVGGWAPWPTTGRRRLACRTCTGPTRLFLQIDTTEWDPSTGERWRTPAPTAVDSPSDPAPTGVAFGAGFTALRLFTCDRCPNTPPRLDLQ